MRSIRIVAAGMAVALATALAMAAVQAETAPTMSPEDAFHAREAAMKLNGRSASAINKFLRDSTGTLADVQAAAAALKAEAPDLETFLALFPEGSAVEGSDAKPEIWTNWDDFQAKSQAFVDGVAALDTAAAGGDSAAIATAFQQMGGACTACHQDYRKD
jgi:cytochrome c556